MSDSDLDASSMTVNHVRHNRVPQAAGRGDRAHHDVATDARGQMPDRVDRLELWRPGDAEHAGELRAAVLRQRLPIRDLPCHTSNKARATGEPG